MKDYIFNKILSVLLLVQFVLVRWASHNPEWVEKNYSNALYPYLSRVLRRVLGWIPVSVGDIIYFVLFVLLLRWLVLLIRTRFSPFRSYLYAFGGFLSVVFFLFHLLWGLNYYRLPLAKKLGVEHQKYTTNELLLTTQFHIDRLNALHDSICKNDTVPAVNTTRKSAMRYKASRIYKNLSYKGLDLHFSSKSCKNSLYSLPLTYMGFSGYLNPFTGEAQVNYKIPGISYPVTVCHELAHQLGYASEDEANYIGYLACENSGDLYFRYSGELLAVQYLLYSVLREDKTMYEAYFAKLHYGVRLTIQYNRDFWDSYQNPIQPFFKKSYDAYLKANRQEAGIQSYGAVVKFLIHDAFARE